MELYLKAHTTAFPLKQVKIAKKYLKRSHWITNGLLKSSITKSKLLKLKLRTQSVHNINTYKQYCSLYINVCGKPRQFTTKRHLI